MRRLPLASLALLATVSTIAAQEPVPLCQPAVSDPVIVASHDQTINAGKRAEPPLINTKGFGFAWPDTQMGAIKLADGSYEFFTSDGAFHPRQTWRGEQVGNNNYGSVTTTIGTLDNPLGSANPRDVTISPNPDPAVNPNYSAYTYIGGGPVYQVPAGMTGAGNLIVGYHAELPSNTLYAIHGLAASWDKGLHWTDLGEIVRPNQSFAPKLAPGYHEIGDGPLVLSPDGKYFHFYFPDWPAGTATTTHMSVARAPVLSVLEAAFGSPHPHTVPFEKFYETTWNLQPGIGGASTDLIPTSLYAGYVEIHFNSYLHRYVLITSNDTTFGYAESADGLHWTTPTALNNNYAYGPIAAYPTSIGLGDDPTVLGQTFYVYFTYIHPENGGEPREHNSLRRITLTCQ